MADRHGSLLEINYFSRERWPAMLLDLQSAYFVINNLFQIQVAENSQPYPLLDIY